jgi:CBS domain-containing protein
VHRPVRNILDKKGRTVQTATPDETVLAAVDRMNEHHIGSLVVVSRGRPIGIFTERDVLTRVVARRRDPETTTVSEVMTEQMVTIRSETGVDEAICLVHDNRCRHLPVIENGQLVGMISAGDLTQCVVDDQEHQISDLVGYIRAG